MLLTFGASRGDLALSAGLFGVVVVVLAITYLLMRLTPLVMRVDGRDGRERRQPALGRRARGARGAVHHHRRDERLSLAPHVFEVEDAMPEALPAALETRRATLRPVDAASARCRIHELGRGV